MGIEFGRINFSDPYVTGFEAYVMQSNEDADKIIAAFEDAIRRGYHPETVEQDIYQQTGVDPASLTMLDKAKITRKVNEIWAAAATKKEY